MSHEPSVTTYLPFTLLRACLTCVRTPPSQLHTGVRPEPSVKDMLDTNAVTGRAATTGRGLNKQLARADEGSKHLRPITQPNWYQYPGLTPIGRWEQGVQVNLVLLIRFSSCFSLCCVFCDVPQTNLLLLLLFTKERTHTQHTRAYTHMHTTEPFSFPRLPLQKEDETPPTDQQPFPLSTATGLSSAQPATTNTAQNNSHLFPAPKQHTATSNSLQPEIPSPVPPCPFNARLVVDGSPMARRQSVIAENAAPNGLSPGELRVS